MLALADPDLDNGPRTDRSATMRMCAVTRAVRPIDELIRFVVSPQGEATNPGPGAGASARRAAPPGGRPQPGAARRAAAPPDRRADPVCGLPPGGGDGGSEAQ